MRTWCVFALTLVACGGTATPEEVRKGLLDNLPPLAADLNTTGESVTSGEMAADFDASMTALNAAFPSLPISMPTVGGSTTYKLPATEEEVEADLRELVETIFTEANHEGGGVYRVHGDVLCDSTDPEYASCVADVEATEIRIRADVDGGDVQLTLLIGPSRSAPLALTVGEDVLELALDLAEARAALLHIASVSGETLELPSTMKGKIAVSLRRNARHDWTAALAIRQAIEIAGSIDEGTVSVSVAARDPMLSLRANGDTRSLTATVDVGPIAVTAPWSAVSESLATGTFRLDWRGLTGKVTVADGDSTLTLEDVGLGDGPSTAKLDAVTLFSIALNPDSGRQVDITFAPSATGLPTIAFAPGLVLDIGLNLAPLAAAGDVVDSWALDESYHLSFGSQVQPVAATTDFAGGLRAISGGIEIAATKAGASLSVPAGQCLVEDLVTDGEHPIIGALAARACP